MSEFFQRYGPWEVVAGAFAGLGAELASRLVGRGVKLVLVARREEKLREPANPLMSRVMSSLYKSRAAIV